MPTIPRDSLIDSTFALLADPYRFISKRCRRYGSELFEARILLRRTICMTGARAAELFYDPERFQRTGAAPEPLRATLFGDGVVQGLDGAAHLRRKALFIDILSSQAVEDLALRSKHHWNEAALDWVPGSTVVLYDEAQKVLARCVCDWAGVPLAADEEARRVRDLVALFDDAARGGLNHLRARLARHRAERWIGGLIEAARDGRLRVPMGSALQKVAEHRDATGRLLTPRVAAAELLNVLRPTVATSVYVVFAAHALHLHPAYRTSLRNGDRQVLLQFLQEVRRHYPFFPAVIAKVRHDFEWNGFHFAKGRRAMLDLYGINHDPSGWQAPERFRPERFGERVPGSFEFVPRGGADAAHNHRCPGERLAVSLMAVAIDFLVNQLAYEVVPQDLRVDHRRVPALPRSGFVIRMQGQRP
jgi:fatty-acid peroxygenase